MGSGYVGLVVGASLAELGNDVTCIDVDEKKIQMLNGGKVPIFEPGLEELISRNMREERLKFTTNTDSLATAQLVFVAVGTPQSHDGSADLKYVCKVAETIGNTVTRDDVLVVVKSTVPIGTNSMVRDIVTERAQCRFHVVSNPEFLKEGAALNDFMKPARIVVGTSDEFAAQVMDELYAPLVRTGAPILHMDVESAEMTKYAANAMLATRISFMNEIANLCDRVGADVAQVRRGIGSDPRIGKHFLFPGVGYGGSCFPKDVRALVGTAKRHDYRVRILEAVDAVNEDQKRVLVNQVVSQFGNDLTGKKLAVWGLAFKANTDDVREAPALVVIDALLKMGAEVAVFDPEAHETAAVELGDSVSYGRTLYDVVQGAHGLLVITDWNEFRQPNMERVREQMAPSPVIFDGRNLYNPSKLRRLGFAYLGIGRTAVKGN